MNASSESGLWATWMVVGIMKCRRTGGQADRRSENTLILFVCSVCPSARPPVLLRLLLKLLEHRRVFEILDPLLVHFALIMGQKFALGTNLSGAIALDPSRRAPDDVSEQMSGGLSQDGVGQGRRGPQVSGLKMNHRCMVARVNVSRIQLIVRAQGHGGELGHLD